MALDSIIWFALVVVIGGSIGMAAAKFVSSYQKEQDKKKMFEVIEGKIPNNLKLDGKIIKVDKFVYKDDEGEVIKVKLGDLAGKTSQKPLKEEKKGFFNRLLIKYWKRRETKWQKKKQ